MFPPSKPRGCGTEAVRPLLAVVLLIVVCVSAAVWRHQQTREGASAVFEPPSRFIEPAPLCPWREPDADLARFFPGATHWTQETHILSGHRLELEQRLGRRPAAAKNLLQCFLVLQGETRVGTVLTRRVAAEHGAMELVIALDARGKICALRVQRDREPESVAAVLASREWQERFLGQDVSLPRPEVSLLTAAARCSASNFVESVCSALILLDVASATGARSPHH